MGDHGGREDRVAAVADAHHQQASGEQQHAHPRAADGEGDEDGDDAFDVAVGHRGLEDGPRGQGEQQPREPAHHAEGEEQPHVRPAPAQRPGDQAPPASVRGEVPGERERLRVEVACGPAPESPDAPRDGLDDLVAARARDHGRRAARSTHQQRPGHRLPPAAREGDTPGHQPGGGDDRVLRAQPGLDLGVCRAGHAAGRRGRESHGVEHGIVAARYVHGASVTVSSEPVDGFVECAP